MATKHIDLVAFTKKYKGELHEFFLDLASWRKFTTAHKLTWQKQRFDAAGHAKIPAERGIYVFTAELSPAELPAHGYIMYIGITERTLHTRYAEYMRQLKNEDGRPAVLYMLKNWGSDLFFNFVTLPDKTIDLAEVESTFINAIMPPVNKRDFEAQIAAPKAAAF